MSKACKCIKVFLLLKDIVNFFLLSSSILSQIILLYVIVLCLYWLSFILSTWANLLNRRLYITITKSFTSNSNPMQVGVHTEMVVQKPLRWQRAGPVPRVAYQYEATQHEDTRRHRKAVKPKNKIPCISSCCRWPGCLKVVIWVLPMGSTKRRLLSAARLINSSAANHGNRELQVIIWAGTGPSPWTVEQCSLIWPNTPS